MPQSDFLHSDPWRRFKAPDGVKSPKGESQETGLVRRAHHKFSDLTIMGRNVYIFLEAIQDAACGSGKTGEK
jgi:hypothetical protein